VWHVENIVFFKPICRNPTCVNRAIVEMNHKLFLMRRPSSRKDHLFERNHHICHKIGAVYFSMIWESVDNIEVARIPYDCKHKLFALNIRLDFVIISSLDRIHMRRGDVFKKKYDSLPVTRWCQLSRSTACKNGNIALARSFRFLHKSSVNRCHTQYKGNDLKPMESVIQISQQCWMSNMQSLSYQKNWFKRRFV
jgi:hypothetical protein